MIHFRFHVVSIIAVFLALAIGTVMGSAFVGKAVINNLQKRNDIVSKKADERNTANENLKSQIDDFDKYVKASAPFAVARTLTGVRVNLVAERGIDGGIIDAQAGFLRQAGAIVPGVVWLESTWKLDSPEATTALRSATGLANRSRSTLRAAAGQLLGRRLSTALPIGAEDVLAKLSDAKFVTVSGVAGSPTPTAADFLGDAARVLEVGGPGSDVPADVIPGIARGIVVEAGAVAVGEVFAPSDQTPERSTWIDAIANDDVLRNHISTIDDLDRVEGQVGATLALAELGGAAFGNYGLDRDRAVPERVPTIPVAR